MKPNPEEQEILDAFEANKLKPVLNMPKEMVKLQAAAVAAFQKESRINIRISSRDLRIVQKRELIDGLPYQTMIGSLLHKYAKGRLVEQR